MVGSISPGQIDTSSSKFCHRVSIKELPPMTPSDAIRALEQDFRDCKADEVKVSQNDILFLSIMEREIEKNDQGYYQMPLPFKCRPCLPDNRRTAMVRLKCLQRKLQKDTIYKEHYLKFMNTIFAEGHAEIANNEPRSR